MIYFSIQAVLYAFYEIVGKQFELKSDKIVTQQTLKYLG
jgi:hypothetical protein